MEEIRNVQGEMNIKITDRQLTVDHVLERSPNTFSIKGKTVANRLSNLEKTYNAYNNHYGKFTIKNNHIYYTDNKNNAYGTHHIIYGNKHIFEAGKTYTISYKCHSCSKNVNIQTYGHGFILNYSKEPGIHKHTFTPVEGWDNYNFHLLTAYTSTPAASDSLDEFHYEILSITEGEELIPIPLRGIHSAGVDDGITIATQGEAPILGEYEVQGEVSDILDNIESKIAKTKGSFKVTWI